MLKKASELQPGDIIKDSSGIRVRVIESMSKGRYSYSPWCVTKGRSIVINHIFNYETGYDYEFEVED